MTVPATPQEPSPFVRRLRAGEQLPLPADSVAAWETFPFEGDLRVKPLQPPILPEPARLGEDGPEECPTCRKPVTEALWSDDHWRLDAVGTESRLPAVVMLQPRGHYDLTDLPAERAAELGPLLQRAERAVRSLDAVARVHVNRWGDGAAHLHFWLLARPAGLMQLRGTFLPVWEELLPPLPDEERREAHRRIAAALAAEGGTAHPVP
ncbi:HIT family protein [Streptomyces canus]|uniref:HIT family protein n=1 Tax=Streptomyces canus TaxID=58343 RepID=UPI0036E8D6A9